MAHLFLEEATVNPVLGEVADVAVPERVRGQLGAQPERVAVGDEAGVDLAGLDPPAAFGHPQGRMIGTAETGPDVLHVVGHRVDGPVHDREHVAPARRLAPGGLAVADVKHAEAGELGRGGVGAPVDEIEFGRLGAAQPPAVDDLEQGGVAVGGQCTLAFGGNGALHLIVGVVQEPLQLFSGERPGLGVALVIAQVRDGVPLVADGHRMGADAERLLARQSPAVAGVGEVLAEEPQVDLVAPDRGRGEMTFATQRQGPLLDVARPPTPRVLVGERQEPPHQPHARLDRVSLQAAGALLGPPTAQHRLEHGVFGPQLRHPRDQFQAGRPHQITTSQIALLPLPSSGMIMHLTGCTRWWIPAQGTCRV